MSKTKQALKTPAIGMKLFCHQPELSESAALSSHFYHLDAIVIKVDTKQIVVRWIENDESNNDRDELKRNGAVSKFSAKNLENFWEIFKEKKAQKFCYDPIYMWTAHDGDGGAYAYESEEDCLDYADKNGEEDSIKTIGRSEREMAAPEMYVLLKQIHERLMDFQTGKSKPSPYTLKDIMGLMLRIDDVIKAAEKDKNLQKIVTFLKIPAAY